jgi:hypothetical protein
MRGGNFHPFRKHHGTHPAVARDTAGVPMRQKGHMPACCGVSAVACYQRSPKPAVERRGSSRRRYYRFLWRARWLTFESPHRLMNVDFDPSAPRPLYPPISDQTADVERGRRRPQPDIALRPTAVSSCMTTHDIASEAAALMRRASPTACFIQSLTLRRIPTGSVRWSSVITPLRVTHGVCRHIPSPLVPDCRISR